MVTLNRTSCTQRLKKTILQVKGLMKADCCKATALSILMLLMSACGGSGGGGNGPTSPSTTVNFSGVTSPGNDTVYMAINNSLSSGNTLAIDVKANNISGSVFGSAFDVDFDSSKVTYESKSAGDFFEQGGNTVYYLVRPSGSNKIIAGVSSLAPTTGVTGSGIILTLKFKVTGSSSLSFSNSALGANPPVIATWNSGTITVQ